MSKKKYFTYREETPNDFSRCVIVPADYDNFPFNTQLGGSYALAPARVLGMTYVDYLRFILWAFPDDVVVEGKNSKYPIAYWKFGPNLQKWLELLNAKMNLAILRIEAEERYGEKLDEAYEKRFKQPLDK